MLLELIKGQRQFAKFTYATGKTVDGEFLLDGRKSTIALYIDAKLFRAWWKGSILTAELARGGHVTFLDCVVEGGTSFFGSAVDGRKHETRVYPHFALAGGKPLSDHTTVRGLGVLVDDFASIYDDFDAFGADLEAEKRIGSILEDFEKRIGRKVEIGDHPMVAYYSGRGTLFDVEVPFGSVSTWNRVGQGMGSTKGVAITNEVMTNLAFAPAISFMQAIRHLEDVLGFLHIVTGRRQNVLRLELEADLPNTPRHEAIFDVHWSTPPQRSELLDDEPPHPADLPLNAGHDAKTFAAVMAQWLGMSAQRLDARLQFFNGFSRGNHFNIDRLVSGANMFDILPVNAAPADVALPEELQKAKIEAKAIFKALPSSPERDSVLGALGRIGKANLKQKARHRAAIIRKRTVLFPDLDFVLDEAINCRNHYVHGSAAKIDYRAHFAEVVPFFTRTLEFVFATSDLIDAGWNANKALGLPTTGSHPFGDYRARYPSDLKRLKALLAQTTES